MTYPRRNTCLSTHHRRPQREPNFNSSNCPELGACQDTSTLRREVTHCELFENVKELVDASLKFFRRYNEMPDKVLSIIGAKPQLST